MSQTRQIAPSTTVETVPQRGGEGSNLVLRLNDPGPSTQEATDQNHHVRWATDTVDNEGMGKKKSKCCCIYKKPKKWDESDTESDSDNETEHCRGHVEKRSGGGCGGDKCSC
ncbi:unnamed protein product, partial [Mesorhabditis belari]|uniref:E3 ubiquitin-protein ligase PPP1R11 n=1 Tax=Mesorhabditis belari TaxID=2138241 RepID=A0AAF3J6Y0_9BILA